MSRDDESLYQHQPSKRYFAGVDSGELHERIVNIIYEALKLTDYAELSRMNRVITVDLDDQRFVIKVDVLRTIEADDEP